MAFSRRQSGSSNSGSHANGSLIYQPGQPQAVLSRQKGDLLDLLNGGQDQPVVKYNQRLVHSHTVSLPSKSALYCPFGHG